MSSMHSSPDPEDRGELCGDTPESARSWKRDLSGAESRVSSRSGCFLAPRPSDHSQKSAYFAGFMHHPDHRRFFGAAKHAYPLRKGADSRIVFQTTGGSGALSRSRPGAPADVLIRPYPGRDHARTNSPACGDRRTGSAGQTPTVGAETAYRGRTPPRFGR